MSSELQIMRPHSTLRIQRQKKSHQGGARTCQGSPQRTCLKGHVKAALKDCGYPEWALQDSNSTNKSQKSQHHLPIRRTAMVIPYVKGLSEELRRTLKQHGVGTIFKPYNTLRQLLSFPKDPQKQEDTCGPIYRVTCKGWTVAGRMWERPSGL